MIAGIFKQRIIQGSLTNKYILLCINVFIFSPQQIRKHNHITKPAQQYTTTKTQAQE